MKVALFGGTGFVGTYITEELLNNNHDPVLLVRPGSENKVYLPDKCHVNIGDITDFESIEQPPLIHISEPTRPLSISYAVFCLKKKKKKKKKKQTHRCMFDS